MAAFAFLAERAFMRLVFLVAGNALALRFPEFLLRLMAAIAGERLVRAFQIEIGEFVGERFLVELHYIGVSAFVIGVAVLAFGIDRIGTPPVQAAFLLTIGCDILVASHAQPLLR